MMNHDGWMGADVALAVLITYWWCNLVVVLNKRSINSRAFTTPL